MWEVGQVDDKNNYRGIALNLLNLQNLQLCAGILK
jgi:hypothetical protein